MYQCFCWSLLWYKATDGFLVGFFFLTTGKVKHHADLESKLGKIWESGTCTKESLLLCFLYTMKKPSCTFI